MPLRKEPPPLGCGRGVQARFWQAGQKKVERCNCTMRRTLAPQRRQR
jgi:hypothetical protein